MVCTDTLLGDTGSRYSRTDNIRHSNESQEEDQSPGQDTEAPRVPLRTCRHSSPLLFLKGFISDGHVGPEQSSGVHQATSRIQPGAVKDL